ncbi:zinc finger protein 263-like isoform X2 [Lineus longissimus]|uniref:zinc finger protein 263-like isoform X2 n=1 Tax=Lineus longissimus TaxID=88925 RepID=UPI00315DDA3E
MMKDSTMSVADTEDFIPTQESSPTDDEHEEQEEEEETENSPFVNMQTELHCKGAVLTRAWSDLFSFITKYQAELVVKENSVEIAEKEIKERKRQLEEMKPVVDAGNEEVSKLQDEIRTKERLLSKAQSQLSVKERMLQRVQSDLSGNMEMLEKSRSELLSKQNDVIRYRGDLERLRSELTISREQIQIKDNLLKKLQNQLMKENLELKEQLELERRSHELEKRSHELTKRSMMSQMQNENRKRPRTGPSPAAVIEIPDSPPTLDLSNEHDFGLSNIISMTESQSTEQDTYSQRRFASPSPSFSDTSSRLHHLPPSDASSQVGFTTPQKAAPSPSKYLVSPSMTPPRTMSSISEHVSQRDTAMTSSDTFFPLSVSASEDLKPDIDSLQYMDSDTSNQGPVPISGPMPVIKPGTPSSGTSDSSQGPVPVSGPIPSSAGMSPGGSMEGGDGKILGVSGGQSTSAGGCQKSMPFPEPRMFPETGDITGGHSWLRRCSRGPRHRNVHYTIYKCQYCAKTFNHRGHFVRHERIHTGEKPYQCDICGKDFSRSEALRIHKFSIHEQPNFMFKM